MASAMLRCFNLAEWYWLAAVLFKILKALSLLITWLESIKCFKMDDLIVPIVPLAGPTGRCSLILLCSCLVVRPMYRTPQELVNWYMHMEVIKRFTHSHVTAIIDLFYLIFIITVNARWDVIEKISLHYICVLHLNIAMGIFHEILFILSHL